MIIMARDRGYDELLPDLEGHRVLVWTCNTCARFCNGLGGREAAEALAERLSKDGIDVVGTVSSSACCFMSKAAQMAESKKDSDLVLALCCDIGARNASVATGIGVLNPVVTFGAGYLDSDGTPRAASVICGRTVRDESLSELAEESGSHAGPFRCQRTRYNRGLSVK